MLLAPAVLVIAAAIIPITGPLVGIGLATVIALAGADRWRARTERIWLIGRPLLYYIVYPALLP